ncbi:hypothetical protein C4553_03630 [Candidatus Parcubacteria bacterium]|nr:MAG: hypothetical protein C4553_03630 [Candidatus Parcubacteria bacterium]
MNKGFIWVIAIAILLLGGWFLAEKVLQGLKPIIFPPPQTDKAFQISENLLLPNFPLSLDPNLKIGLFAQGLDGPRVIALDPKGTLVVSLTGKGAVVALPDKNNDNRADETVLLAANMLQPHGLAFWQEPGCQECPWYLYIARTGELGRYEYDADNLKLSNYQKILSLPSGGGHFTRTVGFGPDNKLYISIGSTCNVCIERDERRATIMQANPDGSGARIYAKGLRNSVFFVWHPTSKEFWATDMGRDWLGDNLPPDEINIIQDGGNYGWPICYGKNVYDTQFDKNTYIRNPCMEPFEKPSLVDMPAHIAPLGLTFVPQSWPTDLAGDLLVAWHGSWNSSAPVGYKVVRYEIENNRPKNETPIDFISGWLQDGRAISRPVDLKFDSKDRLFVSDDKGGMIYIVLPK